MGDGTTYGVRGLSISHDSKFIMAIGYGNGNNMFLRNLKNGKWVLLENYFEKVHQLAVCNNYILGHNG